MKVIRVNLIAIVILLMSPDVYAGLFGFKNYEDCYNKTKYGLMERWINPLNNTDAHYAAEAKCAEYREAERRRIKEAEGRKVQKQKEQAQAAREQAKAARERAKAEEHRAEAELKLKKYKADPERKEAYEECLRVFGPDRSQYCY